MAMDAAGSYATTAGIDHACRPFPAQRVDAAAVGFYVERGPPRQTGSGGADHAIMNYQPSLDTSGGEAPGPLYRRVAASLRAAIADGTYAVGSPLPTEAELCEAFAVSRHTVREALRRLTDLGLVERRQGSGTQVVSVLPRADYVHSMRSLHELFQYARETHLAIDRVDTVPVTEAQAELIPATPGSRWLKMEGVRWTVATPPAQAEAICYAFVFAHLRFAPHLHDVRTTPGPIYALIEGRSGEAITEAVQEISAQSMPAGIAAPLSARGGSPALRFVRRYLDASGAPMLTSVNWHPADRFVYRMRLKRGDEQEL